MTVTHSGRTYNFSIYPLTLTLDGLICVGYKRHFYGEKEKVSTSLYRRGEYTGPRELGFCVWVVPQVRVERHGRTYGL